MKFEWKHIFKKLFKQLVPRMKIFRNYSVEVKLSNYCQTICRKQFCAILMRGKKRLSLNVFGESAVKSIFEDALSVRALLCWTNFGKKI